MDFLATHARLSSRFAEQIGLDDVAVASFRQAYEQWDGKGVPLGLRGSEITLPARLVQLTGPVEVYARLHGVEAARTAVGRSSGADLDPDVARLTDRMLVGIDALAASREIAGRHHERLDGSGYPSGLTAASLRPRDRLLAAADAYHAMTEPPMRC